MPVEDLVEDADDESAADALRAAIKADPGLTPRQRRALTEVYDSMLAATRAEKSAT